MPLVMSAAGKVCCHYCGADDGVKTYSCPFKYCELTALCAACAPTHPEHRTKAGHRAKGCEAAVSSARAKQTARRLLKDSDHFVLSSSAKLGGGIVHALFRSGLQKVGRFMTESVYDKCGADEAPTLDYCERIAGCTLPDAPDEFDADDVTSMMETARPYVGVEGGDITSKCATASTTAPQLCRRSIRALSSTSSNTATHCLVVIAGKSCGEICFTINPTSSPTAA